MVMEKAALVKTPRGIFEIYRDSIILKNIEWKGRWMIL
jgi:hypothetical protein